MFTLPPSATSLLVCLAFSISVSASSPRRSALSALLSRRHNVLHQVRACPPSRLSHCSSLLTPYNTTGPHQDEILNQESSPEGPRIAWQSAQMKDKNVTPSPRSAAAPPITLIHRDPFSAVVSAAVALNRSRFLRRGYLKHGAHLLEDSFRAVKTKMPVGNKFRLEWNRVK